MPCDTLYLERMTKIQRKKEIADALAALEKALKDRTAQVKIGANGAVAFNGTWDRRGVSDVCAYRKLTVAGSPVLRSAIIRAEMLAGRKVDPQQVAAGTHSHDGGHTWHKGH